VYFGPKNQTTINSVSGAPFNAVSGDRVVVSAGKVVPNLAALAPAPRTAIGVNRVSRWLILAVVDGRQPGYSEGMTLPELADVLISYGVYNGVNMDGGGSSTMAIRHLDGNPLVLNSPIDQNIPRQERAVANHLGIFIK
jgi:exopolysaccharide biosynthesis protein